MKTRTARTAPVLVVAAVLAAVCVVAPRADSKRYRAHVFPNRAQPVVSVPVDDFRVNETVTDQGGVQFVWLHTSEGAFKFPFETIESIELTRFLGVARGNIAQYEARIFGKLDTRAGSLDIVNMRGVSRGVEWYLMPGMQADRGESLYRIVFGETPGEPVIPAPQAQSREAVPPVVPPVAARAVVVGAGGGAAGTSGSASASGPAGALTTEAQFARQTIDQLNAEKPLLDTFFDFDKSDLRVEAQTVLQRNAEWLKRWTSVRVRAEGYADVRGSNEYNLELGERRADAVKAFLVSEGVAADRIAVASMGKTEVFCSEQTEACWARNRRARFIITAK
jgi:peptidoglycan-associated lipoprotein